MDHQQNINEDPLSHKLKHLSVNPPTTQQKQPSHAATEAAPTLQSLIARCIALQDSLSALAAQQNEQRDAAGGKTNSDDLPRPLELGPLQQLVKAECKALERVAARHRSSSAETEEKNAQVAHVLRSSNLRYLELVWGAACTSQNLVAFHRRFPFTDGKENGMKRTTLVDVVADAGKLWIKVSTVTEKRMLFDLARAGWKPGDDSDSSEDEDGMEDGAKIKAVVDGESEDGASNGANGTTSTDHQTSNGTASGVKRASFDSEDDEDDTSEGRGLLRTARQLQAAAKRTCVDYLHPRIVFVLPNLPKEGPASSWAADVLVKMQAEGVEVRCGPLPDCSHLGGTNMSSSPKTETQGHDPDLFNRLLPNLNPELTSDVNLDCTILLALISDVSHHKLDPGADLHPAISRQILREHDRPLLPTVLYPALAGKTLHTATEAAVRMRHIVSVIGTPTEKRRAELLLGEGEGKIADRLVHAQEWAATGVHTTPPDFRIPVRVEPPEPSSAAVGDGEGEGGANGHATSEGYRDSLAPLKDLPPVVATTLEHVYLSAVNCGVWLLGWRHGWTTVTSNRVVARQVETAVEQVRAEGERGEKHKERHREQKEESEESEELLTSGNDVPWRRGPRVWALGTARSLVKKERGLRG